MVHLVDHRVGVLLVRDLERGQWEILKIKNIECRKSDDKNINSAHYVDFTISCSAESCKALEV
jgi:hypothetical protein